MKTKTRKIATEEMIEPSRSCHPHGKRQPSRTWREFLIAADRLDVALAKDKARNGGAK